VRADVLCEGVVSGACCLRVLRPVLVAVTVCAVLVGGVACSAAGDGVESPNDVLLAYAEALQQGRADEAYQMLSNEAKRTVSLEAFRRMVKEDPDDVKDIARALSRPGSQPVVTATVTAPNGDKLSLVYEAGRWTIDGTGIDRYGQATPRQALVGFLRAYQKKRFDVLMRYVPDAEREGQTDALWGADANKQSADGGGLSADGGGHSGDGGGLTASKLEKAWLGEQEQYIAGIVQAIQSAMPTARIEETDDRAAMPYGAGGTVLFLRENGHWKIEDLK